MATIEREDDGINSWEQLRALWMQLSPTLLQFIAALLPIGTYIAFGQGADVLSALAEEYAAKGEHHLWYAGLFIAANIGASLTIWWTARTLLSLDFYHLPPPEGRIGALRQCLQTWWPRILGATPVAIVAFSFYHRLTEYCQAEVRWLVIYLWAFALIHLALALLLLAFFVTRRSWLNRCDHEHQHKNRYANYRELAQDSPATRWINRCLFAGSLFVPVLIWWNPIAVSRFFGTATLLSMSAIVWVSYGTFAMGLRARTGIPVAVVLVIWLGFCSHVMDNHVVRSFPSDPTLLKGAPTVHDALTEWQTGLVSPLPATAGKLPLQPIFIVATEGGGIRAAYFTAGVLGYLQDQTSQEAQYLAFSRSLLETSGLHSTEEWKAYRAPDPTQRSFARRLFAISGVSGGSVGAAVFDALIADKESDLARKGETILGQDHLSPLMGALLFPDALQRFCPIVIPGTDRAAVIEHSFEQAYLAETHSNRFADPFRQLWSNPPGAPQFIPHLCLNSTVVDTGQRLIFSDLDVTAGPPKGDFMDAVDPRTVIYDQRSGSPVPCDVPLSTAAHASARFTYTNPAGKMSSDQRFVDGGYFENSGTATALELVQAIERFQAETKNPMARLVPIVITISNDPGALKDGARDVVEADASEQLAEAMKLQPASHPGGQPTPVPCPATHPEKEATKPFQFASELLSPPRALMATRGARGTMATRTLCEHQRRAWQALKDEGYDLSWLKDLEHFTQPSVTNPQPYIPTFIQFGLVKDGIPLPLGWTLSKVAQQNIQAQITSSLQTDGQSNTVAFAFIERWLGLGKP